MGKKNNLPDENNLDALKDRYEKLKEKYNLPEFYDLNKLFDIEDVDPCTDFFLRKIRRTIADRIAGYYRFVDIILNPSNAPVFFFNLIKKLDLKDKELIKGAYEILGNLELEMMGLDLDYSEKKEAEFLKKIVLIFDEKIRPIFLDILHKLRDGNGKIEDNKDSKRSYFG